MKRAGIREIFDLTSPIDNVIHLEVGEPISRPGTHRGGFLGLLLDSVSSRCVHHAPCPVAVVRGPLDSPGRAHILVGVDGSACGHEALTWALKEAGVRRQPLAAVAAWSWLDQPGAFDPHFGETDVAVLAQAAVARALRDVSGGADVDIEVRPVNDHPARALIEARAKRACSSIRSHANWNTPSLRSPDGWSHSPARSSCSASTP